MLDELIDAGVRDVPDWPAPGITFRDITPMCRDPRLLDQVNQALITEAHRLGPVDAVLGIEARGFIFAPAIALAVDAGFVPVRKSGKLPAETIGANYELEYDTGSIEIHADALSPGERVLVIDDILATGGTMKAAAALAGKAGAAVTGFLAIMELSGLDGRAQLGDSPVRVLRCYD